MADAAMPDVAALPVYLPVVSARGSLEASQAELGFQPALIPDPAKTKQEEQIVFIVLQDEKWSASI